MSPSLSAKCTGDCISVKRKSGVFEIQVSKWAEPEKEVIADAASRYGKVEEKKIMVTALDEEVISVSEVADMMGGAEREVVAIYLGVTGRFAGHTMLVYPQQVAFGLVDMLMDYEYGTTNQIGRMEISALSELGNATGTFFFSSMGENLGIHIVPAVPQVMMDTLGTILDARSTDSMQPGNELLMVSTVFATDERSIVGSLLILPDERFADTVLSHFRK